MGHLKEGSTKIIDAVFIRIKSLWRERIKISGTWRISCFDENGHLRWVDTGKNLVVTAGLNHIADQLSDQGENAMSHMACGVDNTAPAAGQTTLISELARVANDSKTQTGGNTVVYTATFGAGVGTGVWEEIGIFNAASSGTMLDRLLTGTKTKGAGDGWEVTVTLTISVS